MIIDTGKEPIPIEVKSGETVDNSLFDGFRYFTSLGAWLRRQAFLSTEAKQDIKERISSSDPGISVRKD